MIIADTNVLLKKMRFVMTGSGAYQSSYAANTQKRTTPRIIIAMMNAEVVDVR